MYRLYRVLTCRSFFFLPKQAAVQESGSPSRWARPALSAAGGGSGQRAQRAPTRGPSQVRRQRRLWRPATALPGPCRQRRAAPQSTACPTTCVSRQWRQQLGGLVAHGEPGPGRAVGQAPASRRSSALRPQQRGRRGGGRRRAATPGRLRACGSRPCARRCLEYAPLVGEGCWFR